MGAMALPVKPSRPWGAPTKNVEHGESVRADTAGVRTDTRTGLKHEINQLLTVGTHIADCNHMNLSDIQTPSMDNRPRIRDTSGQDHVVARPTSPWRRRKAWLAGGAAGVAVLLLAGWVASGWMSGGRSFDASRVRIAQVTRG